MAKFLANENVPIVAVDAARLAGHDLAWIAEFSPGLDDDRVLAKSLVEGRVLITFDKDFGRLAFRMGRNASCGIILFRPRLRSPEHVSQFVSAVLSQSIVWEQHFSVATEGRLRVIPLPK
jgi:predicted nuclease of predicted toxin-antitoxin system